MILVPENRYVEMRLQALSNVLIRIDYGDYLVAGTLRKRRSYHAQGVPIGFRHRVPPHDNAVCR